MVERIVAGLTIVVIVVCAVAMLYMFYDMILRLLREYF